MLGLGVGLTSGPVLANRLPANSAAAWYFAQNGLIGTPWNNLTRTGLGTRIDSAGLLRYGPANIQPQSDDYASAQWTKRGTAAVTSDAVASPFDGVMADRVVLGAVTVNDMFSANYTMPTGPWVPSLWIRKNQPTGILRVLQGSGSSGNMAINFALLSSNWERITPSHPAVTVSGAFVGGTAYDALQMSSDTAATIDFYLSRVRAQPGTVSDAASDVSLLTTSAARYLPRITYNPSTLASLGLLIEGAATNEVGSHSIASPQMVTQTITVTAAQRTLSFYGTGTVTLSGVATGSLVGSGAYPTRSTLTFTPTAGSLTLTVSGTVQFPQLQTGAVETSYIPNSGTGTAVRVADDWSLSGAALDAALGASRSGFTMTMRFVKPTVTTGLFQRVVGLSNADNSRRFELLFIGNRLYGYSINGGAADEAFVSTDLSAGDVTVNFSVSGATVNISAAGQAVVTLAQCPSGANITRLFLLGNNGTSQLNSTVAVARTLSGQYLTGSALQALRA